MVFSSRVPGHLRFYGGGGGGGGWCAPSSLTSMGFAIDRVSFLWLPESSGLSECSIITSK